MKNKTKSSLSSTYISPVFKPNLNIIQGDENYLFDEDGKKYIDFTSGIAVNAFGHRKDIVYGAIQDQITKVLHTSNIFTSPPYLELCATLTKIANEHFNTESFKSVFLSNSGTEANEAAIKFAKATAKRLYPLQTQKVEIISCINSFHGRTMGSLSVTGQGKYQKDFAPLIPHVSFIEYNNVDQLMQKASDNTAVIIVEPLQGEGGLVPMTSQFAHTINTLAAEFNIVVISDEVQTGLYRTGSMFESTAVSLKPHLITLSKSLGGGLPLGAVITHKTVHDILHLGDHGTTTGGNPVACNMALSVLSYLQAPPTILFRTQSAKHIQKKLVAITKKLSEHYILLGKGHLRGIRIPAHIDVQTIIEKAQEKGLLILRTGSNSIRVAPSLICDNATLNKGFAILQKILIELHNHDK